MALAGIASPLLQFILRSRHRRYSDQPSVVVGLSLEQPPAPERPTVGARAELVRRLDAIASRLMGPPRLDGRAEPAGAPPGDADLDPPDDDAS